MSEENLKKALEFMEFSNLPTMGELRKKYQKMALKMHPDKFPEEQKKEKTEQFQDLNNHMTVIGDIIMKENKKKEEEKKKQDKEKTTERRDEDVEEEEEDEEYKWFKQFNFTKRNTAGYTVNIQNEAVPFWKSEMEKRYGTPADLGNKGMKYIVEKYEIGNKSCKITVTLYDTPKTDNQSKLHIQSSNQFLNDIFVLKELRDVFRAVREERRKNPSSSLNTENLQKDRDRRERGKRKAATEKTYQRPHPYEKQHSCELCDKVFKTITTLNNHKTKVHKETSEKDDKVNNDTQEGADKKQLNGANNSEPENKETVDGNNERENLDEVHREGIEAKKEKIENENAALKRDLKIIQKELNQTKNDLEKKDNELAGYKDKLRKIEKVKKDQDVELKKVRTHMQKCFDDIKEILEEKDKLKEENRLLKNNLEAIEAKAASEDGEGIETLQANKNSGYKRDNPATEATNNEAKKHICSACKFEANSQKDIIDHIKNHKDKCKKCGTVFVNEEQLERHMNLYHRETGQQCEKCNYKTKFESQMKNHIYFKHSERWEEENICKYFLRNSCRFGTSCKFIHPNLCRYQENCMWQSNCRFYHVENEQSQNSRHQNRWNKVNFSQEKIPEQTPCRYFNEGRCTRQDCRYTHFLANRRYHQDTRLGGRKQTKTEMRDHQERMWRPW